MKKIFKKVLSIVLAILFVVGFFSQGDAQAAAGVGKITFMSKTAFLSGGKTDVNSFLLYGSEPVDYELVSVKSSNSKMIKISTFKDQNGTHFFMEPKKLGKCKLTVTYKYKGKKKTVKANFTVKKYVNPCKSIKVNGKSIDLKSNNIDYYLHNYKKSSLKIKLTLKKGWSIEYASCTRKMGDYLDISSDTLLKGKKINIGKGESPSVCLNFINEKGDRIKYPFFIFRDSK